MRNWKDGQFSTIEGDFNNMDDIGRYYQAQFATAAEDPAKSALLLNQAVLETLYGGGFHPRSGTYLAI